MRYLHDQTNVTEGIVMLGTTVCVESAQGCDNHFILYTMGKVTIPWEMSLYQSEVAALA